MKSDLGASESCIYLRLLPGDWNGFTKGSVREKGFLPGFTSLEDFILSANTSFVFSPAPYRVTFLSYNQAAQAAKLWQMMIETSFYMWKSERLNREMVTHPYVRWTSDGETVDFPCDLSPLLHPSCGKLDLCNGPAAGEILWWHLLSCLISTQSVHLGVMEWESSGRLCSSVAPGSLNHGWTLRQCDDEAFTHSALLVSFPAICSLNVCNVSPVTILLPPKSHPFLFNISDFPVLFFVLMVCLSSSFFSLSEILYCSPVAHPMKELQWYYLASRSGLRRVRACVRQIAPHKTEPRRRMSQQSSHTFPHSVARRTSVH